MAHLIEVAFRGNRKEFFSWTGETAPPLKAGVIVEADRGEDFGRVHSTGELAEVRCNGCAHGCGTTPPPRAALRLATKADEQLDRELTAENEDARRKSMERVKANHLVMKLTDAEWQWDRRKLTIFFTAERRVDFRGLVRDLAALFRTRIELKQIGVRDEAKRLSGVGRCGREYCSASWLPDLRPVNLGVAKDQKLSLNPQQISGACGRLMCCLRYEHEFYVLSRRKFPKEGKILTTSLGEEKVIACDIFNERITLRTAEGDSRVIALADLRSELEGLDQPTDHAHDDVPSHTAEYPVDAALHAMLDTVETEIAPLAASIAVITPERVFVPEPVVVQVVVPVAEFVAEFEVDVEVITPVSDEPAIAASTDTSDTSDTSDAESADAAGDATRRKRRRGRRGGRRLRAAEQRRQSEADGSPMPPDGGDDADDGDDNEE
ncbi:PSP1 domain-containing protein [Gemmatimonas groenlandica]|uniref:PSP1 domain-containing protein n=1 Tax=Gemmatimonas groenlandica TaxID=2732249 RepID=UPI00197FEA06|nr:regulatory iron-sulfur-containing complex subunit RicT [Gemmatimonas groenlandica]